MENLDKLIAEKYISVQKHPTEDLYIYNYTKKAQYEKLWTEETMMCRGLIKDGKGNIVSRPFKKFFNIEELKDLPNEEFEVFNKWDGSLGISYWIGDTPYLATRGSFISEQATKGTEILHSYYKKLEGKLNKDYTYLFEIIYPENRIVVDYKGIRNIILLAIINTKTGEEMPYEAMLSKHLEIGIWFPTTTRYDGITDFTKIKEKFEYNGTEGFVIRFKSGLRVKIKYDEYVRLHRILTGITARRIWEILMLGESLDEILYRVPEEFYIWVKNTASRIKSQFRRIELYSKDILKHTSMYKTRKEQAELILKNKYSNITFLMLDNQSYKDAIWKLIKPAHEVPFKKEV